ncbi:TPA: host cell division inhibitor Icd-like protein, partial [Mannheimia haemolytica]
SVEQAQAKISRLFAVLSVSVVNNAANITACDTEQNNRLPSLAGCGYDEVTTKTFDGNRNRYTSGIFLPQIYQSHGLTTPESHSEFAVRATRRNKANAIRTNNADCSKAVVEPLSHPFSDKPLSLTKTFETMKNPNTLYTANTGTQAPIALSSRFEGVVYA